MASEVKASSSFPLMGIAILATIGLAVAKLAGWLTISWLVVFLPVLAVGVWILFIVVLAAVIGAAVLAGIAFMDWRDKRKRQKEAAKRIAAREAQRANVTPMRMRGMDK